MSDQLKGTLITVAGVLVITPDAALIRLVDIDVMSMTFFRALGLVVMLMALALARRGPRGVVTQFVASGVPGFALVAVFVLSQLMFVTGITLTNPSHVLILISAAPLFGALASRLLLGERLPVSTAIAIAAGLAGIVVTASAGLTNDHGADWRGDLAALVCAACMGLSFTLMRRARLADAWTHFALSALINVVWIGLLLEITLPTGDRLVTLVILCGFVQPIAFALITLGPRYLPAPEVALLMLVEAPVGALIVWFLIGLAPAPQAFVGGAVVLAAIAAHAAWRIRVARRRALFAQKSVAMPLTSQSP